MQLIRTVPDNHTRSRGAQLQPHRTAPCAVARSSHMQWVPFSRPISPFPAPFQRVTGIRLCEVLCESNSTHASHKANHAVQFAGCERLRLNHTYESDCEFNRTNGIGPASSGRDSEIDDDALVHPRHCCSHPTMGRPALLFTPHHGTAGNDAQRDTGSVTDRGRSKSRHMTWASGAQEWRAWHRATARKTTACRESSRAFSVGSRALAAIRSQRTREPRWG